MLNNAIYRPYGLFKNALLNPRAEYKDTEMTDNLLKLLDDDGGKATIKTYSRYWHGYLLYMIPLLFFFNVGEVKTLMLFLQTVLLVSVIIELNRVNKVYAYLFTGTVLFINPITTALTFQNADIYVLTLINMLIILKGHARLSESPHYDKIWIMNGALVAFFDFFTYPIVALGIPLLCYCLIEKQNVKKQIRNVISFSFAWMFGWIGAWIGKWIVSGVFTGENTIKEGIKSVIYRTNGNAVKENVYDISYMAVIRKMWTIVKEPVMLLIVVGLVLFVFILLYKNRKMKRKSLKIRFYNTIPVVIIGIMPFVYYFFVKNHSAVHPWLEYRELSVSVFAMGIFLIKILNLDKNIGEESNENL